MASHTDPVHPVAVANRSVEARAEAYYVPRLRSEVHGALQTIARRAASRLHRTAQHASGGWNPPDLDEIMPKAECDMLLADAVEPIEARVFDRIYRESVAAGAVTAATYRPPDATSAEMWSQVGAQVTNVSDTTRQGIRDAMMQGWDQGLSVSQTGDLIRDDFAASIERAEMIARTEYTRIANGSTIAAGQSAGLGAKTWLTAPGAPHPRHELVGGLDGQTVALVDNFDVAGYPGAYPGDPALPADESINCRCSLLLHASIDDAIPPPPVPPDMVAVAPPVGVAKPGTPEALAERLWRRAAAAEPGVTRDMMRVADASGGEMIGLEYRMKTADRLADKIARKAESKGMTHAESAKDLGDTLRFTAQYETAQYARGVDKMIKTLEEEGYRPVEIKNYWQPGDDYQGINAIFLDPHGQKFELQFHTPESWAVKNDTHSLYQQMQEATDPQAKMRIWREMVKMSEEGIPEPHGDVLRIGELERHAPPRVTIDATVPGPNAKAAFDKKLTGSEKVRLAEIKTAEQKLLHEAQSDSGEWLTTLPPEVRQSMLKLWSEERMAKRIAENADIDLEAIRAKLGCSYPEFVQIWSASAQAGDLSKLIQLAAARHWDRELPDFLLGLEDKEIARLAAGVEKDVAEILHEQWENTQEFFQTHNVTTLTLYKGFIGSYEDYGDGGDLFLDTSPLSAWTTDIDAAWSFAWGGQGAAGKGGDTRYIASMTIPVERVQSFYGTGLGVENEKEYLVLGGVPIGQQGVVTDFVHLTLIGEPGQLAVPEATIEERKREQERGRPTTETPT